MRRIRKWARLVAFAVAAATGAATNADSAAPPVGAEPVAASALRAAFLYNFAKFANWPAETLTPQQPLSLCVADDSAVASSLEELAGGRSIADHRIVVRRVKGAGARDCHLLYVPGLDAAGAAVLLDSLRGAPVFTVGDREEFALAGGIAYLFVEGDRMRFGINVGAAHRARVDLSSRLLTVAKIVKDGRDVVP